MNRSARTSWRALALSTALAAVPASLLAGVAPATAATLAVVDATGDVMTIDEDPESDRLWKRSPEQRDGDLRRVAFVHGMKRVTVVARFAELEPTGRLLFATRMRDHSGRKHQLLLEATPKNAAGRAKLADYQSEARLPCAVRHTIDHDRNLVRVGFPRTCIGDPRTLEFTAVQMRHVGGKLYMDNPHNTRANVNVWTAPVPQG